MKDSIEVVLSVDAVIKELRGDSRGVAWKMESNITFRILSVSAISSGVCFVSIVLAEMIVLAFSIFLGSSNLARLLTMIG